MTDDRDPLQDPAAICEWLHRSGGPTHVPSLSEGERTHLVAQLVEWVDQLGQRFALDARALPICWEQHPGTVEALTALRDFERGCFTETAPATAAVEFLGALQHIQAFLVDQMALLGCTAQAHRAPRPTWPSSAPDRQ